MKQIPFLKILSFWISLLLLSNISNAKTIYYVTQSGTGDGSSWAYAAGNIQTMIDKAVRGDEVWVSKGSYYPTTEAVARDPRSRTFLLKSGVNFYGGFAGNETSIIQRASSDLNKDGNIEPFELSNPTILSGNIDGVEDVWTKITNSSGVTWSWKVTGNENNCYQVVSGKDLSNDPPYIFDGFTIRDGNANVESNKSGGGLYLVNPTNCVVVNCYAKMEGGGIYAFSIKNCMVSNCYAYNGGGIKIGINGNFTNSSVSNCSVSNCSATSRGGGIDSKEIKVTNCRVKNCSADNGGGIYSDGDGSIIENCTINECCSLSGGGISIKPPAHEGRGTSFIVNCIISNCIAALGYGGGIYSTSTYKSNSNSNTYIINCTISNCSASHLGGGVIALSYSDNSIITAYTINCNITNCSAPVGGGFYSNSLTASIQNCFVSNNGTSNISGGKQEGIINTLPDVTFIKPTSFIGIASDEQQKLELQTANWQLCKGSPCINSGKDLNNFLTTDVYFYREVKSQIYIMSNPRIQYGKIDIGAYEYILPTISLPVVENFDVLNYFKESTVLYNSTSIDTSNDIKWTIENKKAVFSWKTNLTAAYKQSLFTFQINAAKASKVILQYNMYFEAYSGTISPLGTEKFTVEYSTDLLQWIPIATYSNQNGTIPNKKYLYDITNQVAGKTFFLRFTASGQNTNRIEKWEIDNIIVDTDGMTTDVKQVKEASFLFNINNGLLNIMNLKETASVQLFDMNGRLLKDFKSGNNSIQFALPAHGIYIVRTESKTGVESKKVVW